MLSYRKRLSQLFSSTNFIWNLSKKELRLKYSGAKLGMWWAFILPFLLAFSISLVFTKAFKISIENYTLFVLPAILPWLCFSQSLSESTNSFISNASILKQSVFPREIIPIASVLGNFLNFMLGLVAIIPLFIFLNYKIILLIPVLILLLVSFFIFLCGLSLIFSSINVFYKDVSCFLSFALMVWFWITPIFYSLDAIPYPHRIVCVINPLTYFILSFRDLLYYGRIVHYVALSSICISLSFFLIGYYIFLIQEKELLKRL